MYSRILNCDYEFVSPWWDEVSLNAKDLVSSSNHLPDIPTYVSYLLGPQCVKSSDNNRKAFLMDDARWGSKTICLVDS